MIYHGTKICPDERTDGWTNERGGLTARKQNTFAHTVGWQRHGIKLTVKQCSPNNIYTCTMNLQQ